MIEDEDVCGPFASLAQRHNLNQQFDDIMACLDRIEENNPARPNFWRLGEVDRVAGIVDLTIRKHQVQDQYITYMRMQMFKGCKAYLNSEALQP